MENKIEDYLSFANDQDILKIIQLETLLFSDRVVKVNKYYFSQERNIIITNAAFYNLNYKTLKRRISLHNILGFTVSKISTEFVLHCKGEEYDYHFLSYRRMNIIKILNSAYEKIEYNSLLLSQVEDASLLKYVTRQSEKERNHDMTKMGNNLIPIKEYIDGNRKNRIKHSMTMRIPHKKNPFNVDMIIDAKENLKKRSFDDESKGLSLYQFKYLNIIAYGNYSTIQLVKNPTKDKYYVLKIFNKEFLIDEELIENTLFECKILQTINSPFILKLINVFQNKTHLFFVLPFIQGGDLYHHMKTNRIFDEEKAKLYIAQIALALDELHKNNIIYRDLKPENIMIDEDGYLQLIDFGLCKQLNKAEKAMSFCGTPEFLAPEVITGEGHNENCDWWSLGVLMYEMLFGIPPFYNKNLERMYEMIVNCELKFPKKVKVSDEAKKVILGLLEKSPIKRLGALNGVIEIQKLDFFKKVNFDFLKVKKIRMPYIPKFSSRDDLSQFDINDKEQFRFNKSVHISETNPSVDDENIPEEVLVKLEKNKIKFDQFILSQSI